MLCNCLYSKYFQFYDCDSVSAREKISMFGSFMNIYLWHSWHILKLYTFLINPLSYRPIIFRRRRNSSDSLFEFITSLGREFTNTLGDLTSEAMNTNLFNGPLIPCNDFCKSILHKPKIVHVEPSFNIRFICISHTQIKQI